VTEDGTPHGPTLSLSVLAAVTASLSLVDIEVSEVVKGGPQGPTCLHVVHLLGELLGGKTGGRSLKPQRSRPFLTPTVTFWFCPCFSETLHRQNIKGVSCCSPEAQWCP